MLEILFFLLITLVAIVSAILVVTCKNPINSALALIMTFFCLATYYVMLDAPFMAAVQVMVYAGAIMVLMVFTIMLLNIRVDATKLHSHRVVLGCIIGFFTLVNTVYHAGQEPGCCADRTLQRRDDQTYWTHRADRQRNVYYISTAV